MLHGAIRHSDVMTERDGVAECRCRDGGLGAYVVKSASCRVFGVRRFRTHASTLESAALSGDTRGTSPQRMTLYQLG